MGIDITGLGALLYAKARGANYARSATLGRQRLYVLRQDMGFYFRRFKTPLAATDVKHIFDGPFAENPLHSLGAESVDAIGASDYEGATVIHDLNTPIPDALHGRYSVVIDCGTLEHVFNFPTAVANVIDMSAVGWHIVSVMPANNFCGHGFYQFSPELFFRSFCRQNGCEVIAIFLATTVPDRPWHQVVDPAAYPLSLRVVARRLVGPFATAVVANSAKGLAYWTRRNSSHLSRVIHNGTLPGEPSNLPRVLYTNDELAAAPHPLILFVGRYDRDKNALSAARATISVLRRRPDVYALFLGDGPMRADLEDIVRQEHLERRFSIGPFASNVRFWMKRATLFVSVSNYEGHPNAVIEAALSSLPLVLSDIASHREFLGDEEALYVNQNNGEAVTEGIVSALTDQHSAKARAAAALEKVQIFTPEAMVSAYQSLYADIAAKRTR